MPRTINRIHYEQAMVNEKAEIPLRPFRYLKLSRPEPDARSSRRAREGQKESRKLSDITRDTAEPTRSSACPNRLLFMLP